MLVSALLWLAVAPAGTTSAAPTEVPAAPQWRVDAPLALIAQAPTSGNETRVAPWLGLRATRMLEAAPGQLVVFGGDVAGMLGYGPTEGTPRVNYAVLGVELDVRGLVAIDALHSATTWVRPYGYGGAQLGGALGILRAYDDQRFRPLPLWGLGAGLGLELVAHVLSLRVELGGGMRNGAFAIDSRFAAGAAF